METAKIHKHTKKAITTSKYHNFSILYSQQPTSYQFNSSSTIFQKLNQKNTFLRNLQTAKIRKHTKKAITTSKYHNFSILYSQQPTSYPFNSSSTIFQKLNQKNTFLRNLQTAKIRKHTKKAITTSKYHNFSILYSQQPTSYPFNSSSTIFQKLNQKNTFLRNLQTAKIRILSIQMYLN